ncbi:hemerythrin HHE cation binding domain-containing protein [Sulfuritortus calidifontis]|uniref:Hemerythrin HHE cation binding domain-containing protein n=1 Tax=Sulfuritortus calidifontis TaxID=1914471 RepID=A0A4R3K0Y4_9PROT|nr:hemerythrin domain-containing protein [Sulfuritortus calidifontis]TCS73826.1 hemerythrin HHE cation binding domain-containing protein [Sulfuritortus calidifontis]
MSQITELLSQDHSACDELFAEAENLVAGKAWPDAASRFGEFRAAMERHLDAEENTLFPAFEARTGMSGGPTQVMRMEHSQMRELMEQMQAAVERQNDAAFLGLSETLLMLMRQHNMKEEQILYPMTDRTLGGDAALIEQLDEALHAKA